MGGGCRRTLFPYTTLFRSDRSPRRRRRAHHRAGGPVGGAPAAGSASARTALLPGYGGRLSLAHLRQDRKSTRLNSSHITISYAVICLKKKKAKPSVDRLRL